MALTFTPLQIDGTFELSNDGIPQDLHLLSGLRPTCICFLSSSQTVYHSWLLHQIKV